MSWPSRRLQIGQGYTRTSAAAGFAGSLPQLSRGLVVALRAVLLSAGVVDPCSAAHDCARIRRKYWRRKARESADALFAPLAGGFAPSMIVRSARIRPGPAPHGKTRGRWPPDGGSSGYLYPSRPIFLISVFFWRGFLCKWVWPAGGLGGFLRRFLVLTVRLGLLVEKVDSGAIVGVRGAL